jgi:hypothetical protein
MTQPHYVIHDRDLIYGSVVTRQGHPGQTYALVRSRCSNSSNRPFDLARAREDDGGWISRENVGVWPKRCAASSFG